jgi:hypothetical protein
MNLNNKIQDFSDLLNEIENLHDKKKKLWLDIYENALNDRRNAFTMFSELYAIVKDKPMEHAVHAKSMTSYLERMAKCNDQLIKLAELIADAEKKSKEIDPNDLYSMIGQK